MDEALLSYYNRELAYLRKLGAEFGERHPKIAGRLRLDRDSVEDPHVSRLIESVAFLTARIRHKLDDGYPELTESLMGLLYPDFHAPIPSLSIARIRLLAGRLERHDIAAGTPLLTNSNPLGPCYFRTCFDTQVLPLTVAQARFSAQPFKAPSLPAGDSGQAVLRLSLQTPAGVSLSELAPPRLRFFLNGQAQLTFRLYEYLLRHTMGIHLVTGGSDDPGLLLGPDHLRPCGLDEEHAALPQDGRSAAAHRLLTEYFAFPEKFLFLELADIGHIWQQADDKADIYIHLALSHPELVQGVCADTLLLGCTPVINLFSERLDSMPADRLGHETRLTVNSIRTKCADIHTLEAVHARNGEGERKDFQHFYGAHRDHSGDGEPLYWSTRREVSQRHGGRISRGTDTYLSFVDADFSVTAPDSGWVIMGEALCTNRDLADRLPFGPDEPRMRFLQGGVGLEINCVTPPSAAIQPQLGNATRWQLTTQLSLQHFTGKDGLQVLRETLRLYNFRQAAESRAIIDGITGLSSQLATARISRNGRTAICQGTALSLELDEQGFSGSGLYLFTAILSRFFAQYCSLNTYVQLSVHTRQHPGKEIRWPPRCGEQTLI